MYPGRRDSKYRLAQMAHLTDVISYLDELLEAPDFPDYGPNGLQVPGAEDVTIVATGVSAHLDLFTQAAQAGAQLVIRSPRVTKLCRSRTCASVAVIAMSPSSPMV